MCGGAGKVRCLMCDFYGRITCRGCGGSAWYPCGPCGKSGWFTRKYRSWITAESERSWRFADSAPASFKEMAKAIPIKQLPRGYALSCAPGPAVSEPWKVRLELACVVPHIRAQVICGGRTLALEAIGTDCNLRSMPTFLDDLLYIDSRGTSDTGWQPMQAIEVAQKSRVGRLIFSQVSTGGMASNEVLSRDFDGAVSLDFVQDWHERLTKAYHSLGREAVNKSWRWFGPAAVVLSGGAALLGLPLAATIRLSPPSVTGDSSVALHAAFLLIPIGVAWAITAKSGLRAVRVTAGNGATKLPRQGIKPFLWLAAATVAYAIAGGFDLAH